MGFVNQNFVSVYFLNLCPTFHQENVQTNKTKKGLTVILDTVKLSSFQLIPKLITILILGTSSTTYMTSVN